LSARAQRDLARSQGLSGAVGGSLAADQAAAGGLPGGLRPQQSQLLRKSAASRIQRFWRAHYNQKTTQTQEKTRETWAATRLQARLRGFFVVRRRLHKAAKEIQRHWRGFAVRLAVKRRKAVINVQRHARGLLVRAEMRRRGRATIAIQRFMRGALARQHVASYRVRARNAAVLLQCAARRWKARRIMGAKRKEKEHAYAEVRAAIRIQSVFRGNKGRKRFNGVREENEEYEQRRKAATKLQATARRRAAEQKVDVLRSAKLESQCKAATTIRKHWLCFNLRRRYLQLQAEYRLHIDSVITLQRYIRGYVVRMRLWRNAIRSEEELWAAVEIQRCWRGFRGRVRWETEWMRQHSRLESAARIQRHVRGWLARTRAHRIRKRIARAEFQAARLKFKAAQRIQSVARGRQSRQRMQAHRERKLQAVIKIQSIFRGYKLRKQRKQELVHRHTVRIQAAMRGHLVRNRRFHVLAKVVCIQRNYRRWLRFMPEAERTRRMERWRSRREKAKVAAAST